MDIQYMKPQQRAFAKNFQLQKEEMDRGLSFLKSKPSIMSIVPTLSCNLRCTMCFQDKTDHVELPPNIMEIISKDYYPTLQELWILGGEPLISRECLEIIESMDPLIYPDLHLGLITNGTAVTNNVESLLASRRISWVLVSIDAVTEETYKKIRGGKFNRVIEGIKRLKAIRDRQEMRWNLKIGFTVMRSNMHEVFDFVDLADRLGVNFQFSPVFGDHRENFYHDPVAFAQAKQWIWALGNYLERKGKERIRIERVWARLAPLEKRSEVFFGGDDPLDFETWKHHFTQNGEI